MSLIFFKKWPKFSNKVSNLATLFVFDRCKVLNWRVFTDYTNYLDTETISHLTILLLLTSFIISSKMMKHFQKFVHLSNPHDCTRGRLVFIDINKLDGAGLRLMHHRWCPLGGGNFPGCPFWIELNSESIKIFAKMLCSWSLVSLGLWSFLSQHTFNILYIPLLCPHVQQPGLIRFLTGHIFV